MRVFYHPQMSVPSGGYSPSGDKPREVIEDWISHGMAVQICEFEPCSEADLCLAHDPDFVRSVLSGQRANGHGNRRRRVTDSCRWTCGSMIAASRQAMIDGIACSPSSGFHHAGFDYNGAFCTFNGLIVAVQRMRLDHLLDKAGIIDCDAHYGDGTDHIIRSLQLKALIPHWTFGGHFRTGSFKQRKFIAELNSAIQCMKKSGVGLILYQAGADPHVDDPLGGFMTSAEMRQRDRFVFRKCRDLGLPIVMNLAGGYQFDDTGKIGPVLDLHRATVEEALTIWT